jgi:superfamily I DNA and RNA helicase
MTDVSLAGTKRVWVGVQHARRRGRVKLRRFTGEYDRHGNQVLSAGRLTFESVHRFKGQEAPAVILVDVDAAPDSPERLLRWQRVLYCGMTRATVRLDAVRGTEPHPRV